MKTYKLTDMSQLYTLLCFITPVASRTGVVASGQAGTHSMRVARSVALNSLPVGRMEPQTIGSPAAALDIDRLLGLVVACPVSRLCIERTLFRRWKLVFPSPVAACFRVSRAMFLRAAALLARRSEAAQQVLGAVRVKIETVDPCSLLISQALTLPAYDVQGKCFATATVSKKDPPLVGSRLLVRVPASRCPPEMVSRRVATATPHFSSLTALAPLSHAACSSRQADGDIGLDRHLCVANSLQEERAREGPGRARAGEGSGARTTGVHLQQASIMRRLLTWLQMVEVFRTQPDLRRVAVDPFIPLRTKVEVMNAVLKDSSATDITKRLFGEFSPLFLGPGAGRLRLVNR